MNILCMHRGTGTFIFHRQWFDFGHSSKQHETMAQSGWFAFGMHKSTRESLDTDTDGTKRYGKDKKWGYKQSQLDAKKACQLSCADLRKKNPNCCTWGRVVQEPFTVPKRMDPTESLVIDDSAGSSWQWMRWWADKSRIVVWAISGVSKSKLKWSPGGCWSVYEWVVEYDAFPRTRALEKSHVEGSSFSSWTSKACFPITNAFAKGSTWGKGTTMLLVKEPRRSSTDGAGTSYRPRLWKVSLAAMRASFLAWMLSSAWFPLPLPTTTANNNTRNLASPMMDVNVHTPGDEFNVRIYHHGGVILEKKRSSSCFFCRLLQGSTPLGSVVLSSELWKN